MAGDDKAREAVFHVLQRARAPFEVPPIRNKLLRAYRPADKAPIALKTENGGRTTSTTERPMLDPMATVVVVEFEGQKVEK